MGSRMIRFGPGMIHIRYLEPSAGSYSLARSESDDKMFHVEQDRAILPRST